MSIKGWVGAIMTSALLTGVLCGCAPRSVADGELAWSDAWATESGDTTSAFWEEPDRLVVILGGSSSCPSVVTDVEESERVVTMIVEYSGGPVCTSDMLLVPTYFTLTQGRPVEVVLKDGETEYRLDVVDAEP